MLIILASFALSVIQVFSAWGYGMAVLQMLRLRKDDIPAPVPWLHHLLALAGGLVLQSYLISFAGLAMLLNPLVLAGVLGIGCLLGAPFVVPASAGRPLPYYRRLPHFRLKPLLLLLCIPPILALFLESFVPDFSGDGYLYHISAPLFYVLEGGFVPQPWAFYYHYPLLMEMLYAPALAFGLEQATLHLNFWITMASALALYQLGSALRDKATGAIAAFLFLAAPSVLLWTPTSQPEPGGMFLMIMMAAALLQWRRECESGNRRRQLGYMVIAGILAGGLVGCKILYALFVIAVAGLISVAFLWRIYRPRNRLIVFDIIDPLALFSFFALLTYLPWIIKNWRFTGNPLFPVAVDIFPTVPNLAAGAKVFGGMHGFPVWQGPMDWFSDALAGMQMLLGTFDAGFLAGLVSAPVVWILAMRRKQDRFFWSILLTFFLIVCHYGGVLQTRWFLPVYALLTLAAAILASEIGEHILIRISPSLRKGMIGLILIILFVNWAMGYRERLGGMDTTGTGYHRPWTGILPSAKQKFLEELPYYALAKMVNEAVPSEGRVLVVQPPPYPQVRWYKRKFIQNGQDFIHSQTAASPSKQKKGPPSDSLIVNYIIMPAEDKLMDGQEERLFLPIAQVPIASKHGYAIYRLEKPISIH